ncbi:MAG TPA: Flp family type IVb pilin [Acetobacteraceae bacterium]|nr:Flp family type IVb pilin [Acetobacteraceae bacterium]
MIQVLRTWLELRADHRAVTALEYGLIAGAIAAVIAATVVTMGQNINTTFQTISSSL